MVSCITIWNSITPLKLTCLIYAQLVLQKQKGFGGERYENDGIINVHIADQKNESLLITLSHSPKVV